MTKSHTGSNENSSNGGRHLFMLSAEKIAEAHKRNSDVILRSMQTATTGVNQIFQALTQHTQNLMQLSMVAFQAATSARTLQDVAKVHHDYAKSSMDALVKNGTHITEMSMKIANDTAQPLKQHADEVMHQFKQRTAA